MSNEDKINIKVVILDKIYNFTINNILFEIT